jgi:hypothetical protein
MRKITSAGIRIVSTSQKVDLEALALNLDLFVIKCNYPKKSHDIAGGLALHLIVFFFSA